jgi:uncharacterized membrane protein YcgQ (UPF0703/DUF1980 family)
MKNKTVVICCMALIAALLLSACGGGASGRAGDVAADPGAQKNGGGTASVALADGSDADESDYDESDEAAADADVGSDFTADASSQLAPEAVGAETGDADAGGVLEIGEKMFVGQMNDIYLNPDEYLGKTIQYEGYYTYFENDETGQRYDCIVRNGPGCCGYDSSVGFEVDWKGNLPEVDDWCSVQGIVDIYDENGLDYIVVRADSLDVLPYRGNDTVVQ